MSRFIIILTATAMLSCHALAKEPATGQKTQKAVEESKDKTANPEQPALRTWTSTAGNTVKASFEGLSGTIVILKLADGSKTSIRMSELSTDDQGYITQIQNKKKEEQKKKLEALKTSQRSRRRSRASLHKTDKPDYWNDTEYDVLVEMNSARTKPKEFAEYLKKYRARHIGDGVFKTDRGRIKTQEGLAAVDEAIKFLEEVEPVKELKPSKGLSLAAEGHAKDIGEAGITGHVGTDNSTMTDRINKQGKWKTTIGENISFGPTKGRDIVMQLIVDDGVASRGHRKNIFGDRYGVAGIAFRDHKKYGKCCVIDFAGGFSD